MKELINLMNTLINQKLRYIAICEKMNDSEGIFLHNKNILKLNSMILKLNKKFTEIEIKIKKLISIYGIQPSEINARNMDNLNKVIQGMVNTVDIAEISCNENYYLAA
jgi:lipoate-protein ligase B